ncbi:MAG: hypothetical protein RIT26_1596 [Pseudomonadota bacterium]|jgi:putative oxidoreductase
MIDDEASWVPTPEEQPGINPYALDLLALTSRAALAAIFWQSGRTKVSGYLSVTDSAVELFKTEYRLPFIDPSWAAHLAAYAEHLFPVLLVLGLFTRVTAVGMLLMTAVIQVFVYPNAWPTHLSWAGLMLFLVLYGPGRVSIDRFIR